MHLGPGGAAAYEDVGRPRIRAGVIVRKSADKRRVPAHRYGEPKKVPRGGVACGQLELRGWLGGGRTGQRDRYIASWGAGRVPLNQCRNSPVLAGMDRIRPGRPHGGGFETLSCGMEPIVAHSSPPSERTRRWRRSRSWRPSPGQEWATLCLALGCGEFEDIPVPLGAASCLW